MTAITMLDAIKMGAIKREIPKTCPFCGEDPPLASQSRGWLTVCCENEDCHAQPAVTAQSLTEVWKRWNTRAPVKANITQFPEIGDGSNRL